MFNRINQFDEAMKMRILLFLCIILINFGQLFGDEEISLMLVDESLPQAFAVIEKLTGKSIIYDQNLPNIKINLNISKNLSKDEVIRALESALSVNGITIIDRGDGFLRAVDVRSAVNQSPELIDGSTLNLPINDKIYSKLFTLRYISVTKFVGLIRQMFSQNASAVVPFDEANSLLVTDRLPNLQRLETIIGLVDKSPSSKIESKIFRIKHGDAKNISSVLNKLISGHSSDKFESPQQSAISNEMPRTSIPQLSAVKNAAQNDFKLSRDVSIEYDEYSNSVIVCGSEQDIQQIGNIIDGLDVLLDQVRIEVVIAQVTLKNGQTSGLETFEIGYNSKLDADKKYQLSGDNQVGFHGKGASNERVQSGFHVDGTLNSFSLRYVFNKAKSSDNITVLSAPTIVTTHNREASVKVGESRPIITGNLTDLQNQSSIRNSINYKDIGIELVVTPLIGQNGIIQMKIDQIIQKMNGEITVDGNKQPIISKRQAVSFVSVHDGDVVVLAGLQEKETIHSEGKLWLLGYLPIVGDLFFSPKTKFEQTNELIIFIRPTIITNPSNQDEYYQKFVSNPAINDEISSYERDKKFLKKNDPQEKKEKTKIYHRRRR